jgi:four helix bundle protein
VVLSRSDGTYQSDYSAGTDVVSPPRQQPVRRHIDLDVYRPAFDLAMRFFEVSKAFPSEEMSSLTDQGRRASRSVCANIAEAWRKRRSPVAFVAKLSDAEGEAAESQAWIQFAVECRYLDRAIGREFSSGYDQVIGMLVRMISHPESWNL